MVLAIDGFHRGVRSGLTLGEAFRETRGRTLLSELFQNNPDFSYQQTANQGAGILAQFAQPNTAFNLANRPAEMEQQKQEQEALQRQRNIQNQIGFGNLDLRGQELNARLDPNSTFNSKPPKPATPLSPIAKINSDFKNGFITEADRDAAIAKANSSSNGITIRNPDGTVTQIGGNSGAGLGKKPTNQLQSGIISNVELLDLTDSLKESFNPDFLTYRGQGEQFFTAQAEKLGLEPSVARKEFLKQRTTFVTQTERLFNAYRKEITGAAAAVQELDRLKKSFLNVDQSPSEFEATLDSYQEELKRTIRLRNKLLREGLDPKTPQGGAMLDNAFLTGADDDIEARGRELLAKGMSEQEVLQTLDREGY